MSLYGNSASADSRKMSRSTARRDSRARSIAADSISASTRDATSGSYQTEGSADVLANALNNRLRDRACCRRRLDAIPNSHGAALEAVQSNRSRVRSASENTSLARSDASSGPIRRARYRKIASKWRSKIAAKGRGSPSDLRISSPSGSLTGMARSLCAILIRRRMFTASVASLSLSSPRPPALIRAVQSGVST
ncbi:MAG: hypothetical protein BMS9Abin17_0366 [Acidimicrobiia bacterium]|nr:MAG: hypothetical protein BMS9Abin17_0366 [Acidimicrobiia bacterium]